MTGRPAVLRWLINHRISNPSYAFNTAEGRRGASRRDFLSGLLLFWRGDRRKVFVAGHFFDAASGKEVDQGSQNDNATENESDCAPGSVVVSHYALRLKGENVERNMSVPKSITGPFHLVSPFSNPRCHP